MMTIFIGRGLQGVSIMGWVVSALFPIGFVERGMYSGFTCPVLMGVAILVATSDAFWHLGRYICTECSLRSLASSLLSDAAVMIDSFILCWGGEMIIRFRHVESEGLSYEMLIDVINVGVIMVIVSSICQLLAWLLKCEH